MKVAVVGGGIAGLSTAYFLARRGIHVELFEGSGSLGGLARSFEYKGQRNDLYYHFFCLPDQDLFDLAAELGIGDSIRWSPSRTTFYYEGQLYPFTSAEDLLRFSPIPLRSRAAMGLAALRWSASSRWEHLDDVPAHRWLAERVGKRAYEVVWSPLLSLKFGRFRDQISAAWIWHRIHRVARSRRGVAREQVMGYMRGGTQTLIDQLHTAITDHGGRVHLGRPVQGVLERPSGGLAGVRVDDRDHEFDATVLALPLPQVTPMLPSSLASYRAELDRVDFIGVACLVVHLAESISGSFWCNINDSRIPYSGIIETTELNPAAGSGDCLAYVPHYLTVDHPRFHYPDETFRQEFVRVLGLLKPGLGESAVRSFRVFRSPYAQAICPPGFGSRVPSTRTPMAGLFLIDSTQLYPSDRTISGTVGLARTVASDIQQHLGRC